MNPQQRKKFAQAQKKMAKMQGDTVESVQRVIQESELMEPIQPTRPLQPVQPIQEHIEHDNIRMGMSNILQMPGHTQPGTRVIHTEGDKRSKLQLLEKKLKHKDRIDVRVQQEYEEAEKKRKEEKHVRIGEMLELQHNININDFDTEEEYFAKLKELYKQHKKAGGEEIQRLVQTGQEYAYVPPAGKPKPKVGIMDDEGKVVYRKDLKYTHEYIPSYNISCLASYRNYPWIGQHIKHTWLTAPQGERLDDRYILPQINMEKNGMTWYVANNDYFKLQCNNYSVNKKQRGDTITLYDENNNPVSYKVLYETGGGNFIKQDDVLFEKERNYIDNQAETIENQIENILNSPVTEDDRGYMRMLIASQLQEVAPNNDNYDEYSAYMREFDNIIYNHIEPKTVQAYADKISPILVYLDNWTEKFDVFRERLKHNYYNANILASLSIQDFIPEIFDNPWSEYNDFQKIYITETGNLKVQQYIQNIGLSLYYIKNSTLSSSYNISTQVQGEDILVKQVYSESCEHVYPLYDIIYYTDKNENVFCLSITELQSRFEQGNYQLPNNEEQLDEEFVFRVNRFNTKQVEQEQVEQEQVEQLAPGLFSIIAQDIANMENKIPDMNISQESKCYYCNNFIHDGKYKTIIPHEDNAKIISFCTIECFESQEKWPRAKIGGKNKNKNK